MENSIEDRINSVYCFLNSMHSDFRIALYYKEDLENLEYIIVDYKNSLKENEELKDLIIHKNEYTKKLEEDLFENCSNYVIPKSKIKDKIEEEKLPLTIVGGRRNRKTLEYGIKLGRRQVLQELIEESEEK
nr:MAG TPA: hypothetical protein [Caudoviricetes sp.]